MASIEERVSRVEGIIPHLATKEDIAGLRGDMHGENGGLRSEIAELRGELRALRWIMGAVGAGLAALNLALKFLG